MRNLNVNVLSALDDATTNGSKVDANQLVSASFHAVFGDTNAAGTFKLQASNDVCTFGNIAADFTPTNWVDIPSQTSSITSGAAALLTISNMCYRWIRAVYTSTAIGVDTVATIADTGVAQVQVVTAVADSAGSLNSKWFSISSINASTKAQKNFYVWLDNGSGVDPAIAGKTGVHITYTNNASASTLGGLIATALGALTNDYASAVNASGAVTITSAKPGVLPAAADGTAPTGFTFAVPSTLGVNSNLNNTYYLLYSANNATAYYVWFNVASLGTDPAPAGKTAIAVAISAAASAGTVGSTMATAVAAANSSADFTAAGTTTVTITNKTAGPFTAASDFNTGFTITQTGGGTTTVNVNMNALSI